MPFSDIYVKTSFGKTHVVETGNKAGKPLLVFHGGNTTTAYNLLKFDFLLSHFHVYAVVTIGYCVWKRLLFSCKKSDTSCTPNLFKLPDGWIKRKRPSAYFAANGKRTDYRISTKRLIAAANKPGGVWKNAVTWFREMERQRNSGRSGPNAVRGVSI